jgi:hypothetical protein
MKRALLAGVAVLAVVGSQIPESTPALTSVVGLGATTFIGPEQRAQIIKFVLQQKLVPTDIKERIAIGTTVPADVELHVFPSDWGPALNQYRFLYAEGRIALIEPLSHRVVQVID